MFRKLLDEAQAGDNIGALLRGVQRDEIQRGQVLAQPGSVTCHHKFTAQVYVLTKDEGGRHTPFFNNYRPQFYFRTTDVTGVITLPEGTEMCMPGDNVNEMIHPDGTDPSRRWTYCRIRCLLSLITNYPSLYISWTCVRRIRTWLLFSVV